MMDFYLQYIPIRTNDVHKHRICKTIILPKLRLATPALQILHVQYNGHEMILLNPCTYTEHNFL